MSKNPGESSKPKTIRLKVIPKPKDKERPIIAFDGDGLRIIGDSPNEPLTLCGACDNILMQGVKRGAVRRVVLRCYSCGAYNDTP